MENQHQHEYVFDLLAVLICCRSQISMFGPFYHVINVP